MKRFSTFITVLVLAGVVAGGLFLVAWDIPAPSKTVEKKIADDKLPH